MYVTNGVQKGLVPSNFCAVSQSGCPGGPEWAILHRYSSQSNTESKIYFRPSGPFHNTSSSNQLFCYSELRRTSLETISSVEGHSKSSSDAKLTPEQKQVFNLPVSSFRTKTCTPRHYLPLHIHARKTIHAHPRWRS